MITSLGILEDAAPTLVAAVRTSLLSLAEHQSHLGLIPNKIDFGDQKRVNFRAYADGGLWFVLVAARYAATYPADDSCPTLLAAAERALAFYRYQDHDRSGLVSIDEGSTWMDLFPLRSKSVYVNVLRAWATAELSVTLTQLGRPADGAALEAEAQLFAAAINEKLWYDPEKDLAVNIQDSFSTSSYNIAGFDALGRKLLLPEKKILKSQRYYLAYLTLRDFGEWFDSLGNLLAIESGVADRAQSSSIFALIDVYELSTPHPIRAMYPPLHEGDADWRYYFNFGNLNLPEEYHNGGSWPMIGGFYVAARATAGASVEARANLARLAAANLSSDGERFSFNEHRHGASGVPLGMEDQAWSAGAYLYAYHRVRRLGAA